MSLPVVSKQRFAFIDGYPKVFDEENPADEDVPPEISTNRFEKLNWMKAAFTAADKILTVSPNYAEEISSGRDKGVELDDVLR